MACSLDFARSSSLPEQMPDNVVFTYHSNGGMLPAWRRITIRDDELSIEDKKPDNKYPAFQYTAVSTKQQASLYKIFRENKFDLIENYEPSEITYDAGSESLSVRIPGESHSVSSGDNSPMTTEHGRRYANAARAFFELVKNYRSELKTLRENTVILRFNSRRQKAFIGADAKRASINYENAAKVAAAAKTALKDAGQERLASSDEYSLQLIPIRRNNTVSVFARGICGEPPEGFDQNLAVEVEAGKCTFSFFADPHDSSVSGFKFTEPTSPAS